MERRIFAEVLKNARVDIRIEYQRLYDMFYYDLKGNRSYREKVELFFFHCPFKGTCVDLDDFDEFHNFLFEYEPDDFDIYYLINFMEYCYNLAKCDHDIISGFGQYIGSVDIIKQINNVLELIGYMGIEQDYFTSFVPKSQPAIVVSEMLPPDLSYKVIEYNHHSMKGDLSKKRATLKLLADKLEANRNELKSINGSFSDDLFFLLNNMNIRHNNIDSESSSYKKGVAKMSNEELEKWYDKTYDLCLYAFMTLDQKNRNTEIRELKNAIEK